MIFHFQILVFASAPKTEYQLVSSKDKLKPADCHSGITSGGMCLRREELSPPERTAAVFV